MAASPQGPSGTKRRDQISRRRPRAFLDSRRNHRQGDDVCDRWAVLHAGLRKTPGGRGNGEAIRSFIDLPPDADMVAMFVQRPGASCLLAATSGHGFVTNEDDAVAMTKVRKAGDECEDAGTEAAVVRLSKATRRGDRREPQAADFPAVRSARNGARAGRLSCNATRMAACSTPRPSRGRKAAGRQQSQLHAAGIEGLERRPRPIRPPRPARLGESGKFG